jgi:dihydrofolate reductase
MATYGDELTDKVLSEFMALPFELLLGRRTYDIFAGYWPQATESPEVAVPFNSTRKYVASHSPMELEWNNSLLLSGDVAAQIRELKDADSPDLWVWGSGNLIQTLLRHDLIDRMHLWIHPATIGSGKRLFADGTPAAGMKLVDSQIASTGVILATYEPAGPLKTGTIGT